MYIQVGVRVCVLEVCCFPTEPVCWEEIKSKGGRSLPADSQTKGAGSSQTQQPTTRTRSSDQEADELSSPFFERGQVSDGSSGVKRSVRQSRRRERESIEKSEGAEKGNRKTGTL